jgi:hypothetical protein
MKENQKILDELGKKIIDACFDPCIKDLYALKIKENPPIIVKNYSDLFKRMSKDDFNTLTKYVGENIGAFLFNFLRIFEENHQFKIIYEENGQQIDLTNISESLMSEPIIENGWIQRFSEEIQK